MRKYTVMLVRLKDLVTEKTGLPVDMFGSHQQQRYRELLLHRVTSTGAQQAVEDARVRQSALDGLTVAHYGTVLCLNGWSPIVRVE